MAVEGVNITVSPGKIVVDCFEELKAKGALDPYSAKFKEKLVSLYATLILNYKFEPYFSLEKAKFIMIDTRNDDILLALQELQNSKEEAMIKEMQNKQSDLRVKMGSDVESLRQMLVTAMLKNKGAVSKDEMFIFKQESVLKTSPEMPMTDRLTVEKEIASAQARLETYKSKLAREEAGIAEKVSELKATREEDIKDVGTEYLKVINKLKADNDEKLNAKSDALVARRDAELNIIQKVIEMDIELPDSPLEKLLDDMTVAELKELAVKYEIELTETLKDKIVDQIIASKKYEA